jgi:hypothetical protein
MAKVVGDSGHNMKKGFTGEKLVGGGIEQGSAQKITEKKPMNGPKAKGKIRYLGGD